MPKYPAALIILALAGCKSAPEARPFVAPTIVEVPVTRYVALPEALTKPCPVPAIAGRTVGEERDVAHFPGRIDLSGRPQGTFEVVRFLPPPGLDPAGPWPHLRLDRAIETLIGDRLR